MEMSKVDMYLMSHSQFYPPEKMPMLREQLMHLPENYFNMLYTLDLKNPTTMLLISIFLGEFGVDRFMLGDTGLGVGKLLTLGGCLVWWLVDLFLIMGRTREVNFEKLAQLTYQAGFQAHHGGHHPHGHGHGHHNGPMQ